MYGDAAHESLLRSGWRWLPAAGDYERKIADTDETLILRPTLQDVTLEEQRTSRYMLYLDDAPDGVLWLAQFENLKDAGRCLRREQ